MGFFSRRSRSKSVSKDAKVAEQSNEDKPAPAPYKHIPKHAATDSMGQVGTVQNSEHIALASQHRITNSAFDSTLGNASYRQSMAHSMFHGMPTPSMPASPAGSIMLNRRSGSAMSQRSMMSEIFITDPDAPPMPASPFAHKHSGSIRRGVSSRAGGDYFSLAPMAAGSKPVSPLPDREYTHGNGSSDSGYGSAGPSTAAHSRAASEKNVVPSEEVKSFLPSVNEGLLPTFDLTEQILSGSAFSEDLADETKPAEPAALSVHKPSREQLNQQVQQDTVSEQEKRSSVKYAPAVKQTHLKQSPSVQLENTYQHTRGSASLSSDPVTLAVLQGYISTPQQSRPVSAMQPFDFALPDTPLTAYPEDETNDDSQGFRRPSLSRTPSAGSTYSQAAARSNLPPLSVLEGFKVNKRGKILDEEGEPIGELVGGDIMDCVRQRVNAYGEVLDEFGGVVGIVRTLPRVTEPTTLTRDASPASIRHRHRPSDTRSLVSQQSPQTERGRRRTGSVQYDRPRSVSFSRTPENVTVPPVTDDQPRVELDASVESEAAPVVDHSEIFSPPFIPSRSAKRLSFTASVDEREAARAAVQSAKAPPTPAESPLMKPVTSTTSLRAQKPQQTQAQDAPQAPQEQPRRATRPSSDRSLSDLSKSYARPSMNTVPEDNIAESSEPPSNPELFSYKGIIPLRDGLPSIPITAQARTVSAAPSSRPPMPKAASMGAIPRHVTTRSLSGLPPPGRPGMSPRQSLNLPARRSPLASHETTPNDSDDSTETSNSDDGKFPSRSVSRAASVRTTMSTATTRQRTYFTHAGRITVETEEDSTPTKTAAPTLPKVPAVPVEVVKDTKKKNRFTMSFGRKSQAVKAH